jgi:uncharacterized delta-60 repeat protein
MLRKISLFIFTLFVLYCYGCSSDDSEEIHGSLDKTFNYPNGFVVFNGEADADDTGVEVAIQRDGKIVVMGSSNNGNNDDILVMRLFENGRFDPTFGTEGFITYNGTGKDKDRGLGLALTPDDRIVVTGYTYPASDIKRDVIVLRLNHDGNLDPTFGEGGVVTYGGSENGTDIGFGVAVQPDEKILVAGEHRIGTSQDALLLRYNHDGTPDSSFGTNGVVSYNGGGNDHDVAYAVSLQDDGKIVVSGSEYNGVNKDALIMRFNHDGTRDSTFGINGVFLFNSEANSDDYANLVTIQPDGKILVVGATDNGINHDILLLRLHTNGTLDETFGLGGVVIYNNPADEYDYAWGIALSSDGKIIISGTSNDRLNNNVVVIRFNQDGTLDSSFGLNGIVTFYGAGDGNDLGYGVAIQWNGKIVVTGVAHNGSNDDALVLRLIE